MGRVVRPPRSVAGKSAERPFGTLLTQRLTGTSTSEAWVTARERKTSEKPRSAYPRRPPCGGRTHRPRAPLARGLESVVAATHSRPATLFPPDAERAASEPAPRAVCLARDGGDLLGLAPLFDLAAPVDRARRVRGRAGPADRPR